MKKIDIIAESVILAENKSFGKRSQKKKKNNKNTIKIFFLFPD